ncbi:hypothetical protein IHE61_20915 [Streptomyces sp. GKU 257-1]|nr:hypothetical protein [Streptomyces sp. GKU 257-1]
MTSISFSEEVEGLYALSTKGEAAVSGYWAGFCTTSRLPDPATFEDTWRDMAGVYVFCTTRPADVRQFADGIGRYLAPRPHTRFLWVTDPDADPDYWQVRHLAATPATGDPTGTWHVRQDACLPFGDYALAVHQGSELSPAAMGIAVSSVAFHAPDGTAYATTPGTRPFHSPARKPAV